MVEHVVMGPRRYAVRFVEQLSKKRRVGEACVVTNTIGIRNDQAASGLRSTMIHEVLHHAMYSSAARFAEGWTEELEESFICAVEGPLLELWTREENAPLRAWLQS